MLLAQALNNRADLAALRAERPDLAGRFTVLSRMLADSGEPGDDQRMRHLRERERDPLLAEIRAIRPRGFQLSARPLNVGGLAGPVVVVNIAHSRCDALVVIDGGVVHVPLPDVTYDSAREHANSALRAVYDPT
ncbi:hypothetical protein [Solwaraspora sp. WMMA2065]|uniref:hypothetical protein n=1 Tax=Solwaraspora sp. WMMA2065 TaxID=3015166 RepID=UPI00259BCF60|nr:hypothetical protein [Solwaraspora sp. WMMA2065]WJK33080.1 hypothetical protein O7610_20470 [Solwaraspora sp. WMMA2065]